MEWTKGGVNSPLAKVLITLAGAGIFATLIATGVIQIGPAPKKDECGGCGEGRVCVREVSATRGANGRLESLDSTLPTCRARCDVLQPKCPASETCRVVTGGGACFPN